MYLVSAIAGIITQSCFFLNREQESRYLGQIRCCLQQEFGAVDLFMKYIVRWFLPISSQSLIECSTKSFGFLTQNADFGTRCKVSVQKTLQLQMHEHLTCHLHLAANKRGTDFKHRIAFAQEDLGAPCEALEIVRILNNLLPTVKG